MLHGVVIPDWVPPAVETMAEVLPVDGGEIARRLLTDGKMRPVWKSLRRAQVTQGSITKLKSWQRLSGHGVETKFSLKDEACAAFFASAVVKLSFERPVVRRSEIKERAARMREAADVVRKHMDNDPRLMADLDLMAHFAIVEAILRNDAREIEQRKGAHLLERSSGKRNDDNLRGRVREFAIEMKKIYGICRYGTLATVATVALQRPISNRTVENWCAGLIVGSDPSQ